ncbi:MAG: hypothetical protein UHD07_05055 [Ruminobacter sp.]|nr:hypothetical protein [Ruminobacter sp.]
MKKFFMKFLYFCGFLVFGFFTFCVCAGIFDKQNFAIVNLVILFLSGGVTLLFFRLLVYKEEEPEETPKTETNIDNPKESETLSKNYDKFLNKYNKYYKNINTYSSIYNQIRCYTENNMFMFSHNGRLDAYTEYLKKEYESNYRMKNKIKGYETLILGYYSLLNTYNKLLDGYSELERYPTIKLNKTNYENLKNAIVELFKSHKKFLKNYYDLLITYKKLKGYKVILEDYKTIKTPKRPGYYSLDGYSENYLSEDFLKSMYFYLLDSYDKFNDYHSYSWYGRGIWADYK